MVYSQLEFSNGLSDLSLYLKNNSYSAKGYKMVDFAKARGKSGVNADKVLEAILFSPVNYDFLRNMVKENFGIGNAESVTPADLEKAIVESDKEKSLWSKEYKEFRMGIFSTLAIKKGRETALVNIVDNAKELIERNSYSITVAFRKQEALNPIGNLINEKVVAQSETMIVDKTNYEQTYVGKILSEKQDAWQSIWGPLVLNKKNYQLVVTDKNVSRSCFYKDINGKLNSVSPDILDRGRAELGRKGKYFQSVEIAGVKHTYILDQKPLKEAFVKVEPLKRYYVTLRISNITNLNINLIKQWRNEQNAHLLTVEVPKEIYLSHGNNFKTDLNYYNMVFGSGYYAQMQGNVVDRREETDLNYVVATTADARELIVEKSTVQKSEMPK